MNRDLKEVGELPTWTSGGGGFSRQAEENEQAVGFGEAG